MNIKEPFCPHTASLLRQIIRSYWISSNFIPPVTPVHYVPLLYLLLLFQVFKMWIKEGRAPKSSTRHTKWEALGLQASLEKKQVEENKQTNNKAVLNRELTPVLHCGDFKTCLRYKTKLVWWWPSMETWFSWPLPHHLSKANRPLSTHGPFSHHLLNFFSSSLATIRALTITVSQVSAGVAFPTSTA